MMRKIFVLGLDDINKARSLRNANNSQDADCEKQIIAILGKKNGNEQFEENVYIKEGYELNEQIIIFATVKENT